MPPATSPLQWAPTGLGGFVAQSGWARVAFPRWCRAVWARVASTQGVGCTVLVAQSLLGHGLARVANTFPNPLTSHSSPPYVHHTASQNGRTTPPSRKAIVHTIAAFTTETTCALQLRRLAHHALAPISRQRDESSIAVPHVAEVM